MPIAREIQTWRFTGNKFYSMKTTIKSEGEAVELYETAIGKSRRKHEKIKRKDEVAVNGTKT